MFKKYAPDNLQEFRELAADVLLKGDPTLGQHSELTLDEAEQWFENGLPHIVNSDDILSLDLIGGEDIFFVIHGCLTFSPALLMSQLTIPFFTGMFLAPYGTSQSRSPFGVVGYRAALDTLLMKMPRKDYLEGHKNLNIVNALLRYRYNEISYHRMLIALHKIEGKEKKVARFLILLSIHGGHRDGGTITLNLKQIDLAQVCGLQRTYIVGILKKLEEMEVIERGYGGLRIVNENGLIEAAGYPETYRSQFGVICDEQVYRHMIYDRN